MARRKLISPKEKTRAQALFALFQETYPEVRCTLDFRSPLQLLIMTILAAQCTDARVNVVCRDLFKKYRGARDFAEAAPGELENDIRSCGFFNQKARSIRESCRMLLEHYDGRVPGFMDDLLRLPGVGRKIANAVLGECFHVPGVIVDTHCRRVSNRLGFTRHQDPAKIEQDLMALWPQEHWTIYSHYMVFHGRALCTARAPKCAACPAAALCPWPGKAKKKPA